MRNVVLLVLVLLASACSPKKQETANTPVDSVGVDTVLATTPAPPALAFNSVEGWAVNSRVDLPDSVNYFLMGTQEEFNQKIVRDKNVAQAVNPDFLINWIVVVATRSSNRPSHITLEKVETGESSINVYLTITHAVPSEDKGAVTSVYAIERRDGFPVMQFFVNGKKDKSLVLVM